MVQESTAAFTAVNREPPCAGWTKRTPVEIAQEIERKFAGFDFGDMPLGPFSDIEEYLDALEAWAKDPTLDGGAFSLTRSGDSRREAGPYTCYKR